MEEHFRRTLGKIVADLSTDPGVTALVFFGSVQRAEGKPDSDLDFFVVTTGREYWRSARQVDGAAAELFHNPVPKMYQMLENEDQISLHALVTGELLLDRAGEGQRLVDLARTMWAAGPRPLTPEAATRWRYCITALASDIAGLDAASPAARLVAGRLVPLTL